MDDEDIYLPQSPVQAMALMGDQFMGFQVSPAKSQKEHDSPVKGTEDTHKGQDVQPANVSTSPQPPSGSALPNPEPATTTRITPQVLSITATLDFGIRLDLPDLARRARNAEYSPRRYNALIVRFRDPACTALWRSSGRLMLMGVRGEADALHSARRCVRMAHKLDLKEARLGDYKLVNYLAKFTTGFRVHLERVEAAHGQWASYEPQLFPGLIYRMMRPRCTMMVFASGTVMCTGAKTRSDVEEACNLIYPVLGDFRIAA